MKLGFSKKTTIFKKKRFNPHTLWSIFCAGFLAILTLTLVFSSWYFVKTTEVLDAPVTASLETNTKSIEKMKRNLEMTESALYERTGTDMGTSQNIEAVVE